jgi:hypothetical protein
MRGFFVGSLALIALYVGLKPGTAGKAEAGGNALVATMRRLLSPDVAGIPQRGGGVAKAAHKIERGTVV